MNENFLSFVPDVALATIVRRFSALNVVGHRLLIQVYFIPAQFAMFLRPEWVRFIWLQTSRWSGKARRATASRWRE